MADGSVVFDVNLNVSQANKKLAKLKGDIQKTEKQIQETTDKRDKAQEQSVFKSAELDEEKAKLQEIKDRLTEIRALSKDKSLSFNQREEYKNLIPQVKEELADQQTRVKGLQAEWNKIEGQVERYNAKIDEANQKLNQQVDEAGDLARQIQATEGAASYEATAAAGEVSPWLVAAMQIANKLKKAISTVLSWIKKLSSAIKGLFRDNASLNTSFSSGLKTILKYAFGIRSLYALFNKLRSALREGMKNLAQYSGEVNGSLSAMQSALTQLKNSLATAFAPILTTIEPILTRLINLCSAAADAIARLIAMLSGKSTYVRAIAVQEDYADALKGTGGAAKEAASQLASFDEITQITTEDSKGGGGGGLSVDDMFETVDIEPLEFASWGEAFNAFLDKILNDGIPKLKDGLTKLATWINDFAANLYEMFTFPGVYEKVVQIGHEVAEALNEFVNNLKWETIGRALGAGLNLALGFLVEVIYTFDWINLGGKLAEFIYGLVDEIDWKKAGKLLWGGFKIAIETLAGFILKADMKQLAEAASDIVIGFFDSMSETLDKIPWEEIGDKIEEFLVNVKWDEVADSCFTAMGKAFDAAGPILQTLIRTAAEKITLWATGRAEGDGKSVSNGFLGGIFKALSDIGAWIRKNIFEPFLEGILRAFGISGDSSSAMASVGVSIVKGIFFGIDKQDLWGTIGYLFVDTKGKIADVLSFDALRDIGKTMVDGLLDGLKSAWESVKSWATSAVSWIKSTFQSAKNSASGITSGIGIGVGGRSTYSIAARVAAMPPISINDIPALAAGAVIPPNRKFMAVLGDQSNGNNLEAPESLIRKIVREESGGNNTEIITLLQSLLNAVKEGHVIMVDGTVFGRVAVAGINNITMESGKFPLRF